MTWSWACLPCNVTGTGPAPATHSHTGWDAFERRRNFWLDRFRWAMPTATSEEIAAVVGRPIERSRMVELLGERWRA